MISHSNGVDIVEVKRIERAILKYGFRFLNRVFREEEVDYCMKRARRYHHLAARFAAKEAFLKALKSGKRRWRDVEIGVGKNGEPRIKLHGGYRELIREEEVALSLSHSEGYAIAVVTILKHG